MFETHRMDSTTLLRAVLALLLGLTAVLAEKAFAETTAAMEMTPDRCVAMTEGQTCYQTVTVSWQSTELESYCLFEENSDTALVCWDNANEGEAKLAFESSESVTYRLRLSKNPTETKKVVAEQNVLVTWVYSKTKKRRNSWRLF
jgi:hypothetical protein